MHIAIAILRNGKSKVLKWIRELRLDLQLVGDQRACHLGKFGQVTSAR